MRPARAGALGAALAARLAPFSPVAVVSPAMGGVDHRPGGGAGALGPRRSSRSAWTGSFRCAAASLWRPGERIAVVEDVVTTGKSTREVLAVLTGAGAVPVACGSIIDRRAAAVGGVDRRPAAEKAETVDGVPFRALLSLDVPAWDPAACPLCAKGEALTAPGSRYLAGAR